MFILLLRCVIYNVGGGSGAWVHEINKNNKIKYKNCKACEIVHL